MDLGRFYGQIGPRDDDRAVIAPGGETRAAHAGTGTLQGRNCRAIDASSIEPRQQRASKIIIAYSANHRGRDTLALGRKGLIASLAAELGRPAQARDGLSLSGTVRRVDHDVVMQAADDHDGAHPRVAVIGLPRAHVRPRVARSISMAKRMIRPVARSW